MLMFAEIFRLAAVFLSISRLCFLIAVCKMIYYIYLLKVLQLLVLFGRKEAEPSCSVLGVAQNRAFEQVSNRTGELTQMQSTVQLSTAQKRQAFIL